MLEEPVQREKPLKFYKNKTKNNNGYIKTDLIEPVVKATYSLRRVSLKIDLVKCLQEFLVPLL